MAQVANLTGECRLGQETRRKRLVDPEGCGYPAEEDHAAVLADEPGSVPPAPRAGQ